MHPQNEMKVMNYYQEYEEKEEIKDAYGLPQIMKVNKYDLTKYL